MASLGSGLWESSGFDECDSRHATGPTTRFQALPAEGRELQRVILCLSGGGFRATAYHLGALRRLHELGILQFVDEIRSVSGGSILAAWLARLLSDGTSVDELVWDDHVAGPLRQFLRRDMRSSAVLLTAGGNWAFKRPRVRLLEQKIGQLIGDDLAMTDLPPKPHFSFLSTDLATGDLVNLSKHPVATTWPVTRAVVASAAFPPLVGPISVKDASGETVAKLSDGGVWGNLGVSQAVLTSGRLVLVSDASYPLMPLSPRAANVRLWLARALRVGLQRGDSALRYQMWLSDSSYQRFEVWRISHTTHRRDHETSTYEYSEASTGRIARVRTDLDAFTEGEIAVLENHGYLRASSGLSWLIERMRSEAEGEQGSTNSLPGLDSIAMQEYFPLVRPPHPAYLSDSRVASELTGSGHRLLKLRRLRRWLKSSQDRSAI